MGFLYLAHVTIYTPLMGALQISSHPTGALVENVGGRGEREQTGEAVMA